MSSAVRSTIFKSGRNEAVRIPAAVRFPEGTKDVVIQQKGKSLVVTPAESSWDAFFAMPKLEDGFMPVREQGQFEERQSF